MIGAVHEILFAVDLTARTEEGGAQAKGSRRAPELEFSGQREGSSVLTMSGLHTLPLAVVQQVLAFVDGEYVVDAAPRTPQVPTKLVKTLATVSRSWKATITELQRLHDVSTLHIDLKNAEFDRVDEMYEQLEQSHGLVRALTVSMGTSLQYLEVFNIAHARFSDDALDDAVIDWDLVFRSTPKLQRLDLAGVPMHSTHLPSILLAASTHCQEMKALVLPQREWHRGAVTSSWQPTMESIYTALEHWHHSTPARGLVQLTLPERVVKTEADEVDYYALTDEYLYAVARFCPNIEYLDGWKASYAEDAGQIQCQELLYCSQSAWETFCASCTKLREVNWFVLPFIDDFFNVFASKPKPALEKLTLATGDHHELPHATTWGTNYRDGQSKCSSKTIGRVFKACPNLRELRIVSPSSFYDERPQPAVFDDSALVAVANHCPSLARLEIEQLEHPHASDIMRSITNAGVAAIAPLPDLESIKLQSTACGAAGVLALIRHSPEEGGRRTVDMVVGNCSDSVYTVNEKDDVVAFHETVVEVLLGILDDAEDLVTRRFHVTLSGHANRSSQETVARRKMMRTLVHDLRHVSPWLDIKINESGATSRVVLKTVSPNSKPLNPPRRLSKCRTSSRETSSRWSSLTNYVWNALGWSSVTAS
ncbi:hypothetical protein Poli38472_005206 [Pythium oligandrum]|uniref:F-box domain-containing protein n=1 Tax=Pythium oligandrum TaxID=41045 RepID=A0A8K1CHI5_PYTOL|nr:hypothetical protein Poli38472_005206 [Pythium oligandrum]|eukprot:TMW62588.1 hypothetical protein Poli38472_005206 [Pythium oligandrum]